MNRKIISKMWALLLGVVIFAVSCQKEEVVKPINETVGQNQIEGLSDLVQLADEEFVNSEFEINEESEMVSIPSYGLPDVYDLDENSIQGLSSSTVSSSNTLIECLREVSPNERQVYLLKKVLSDYDDCKAQIIRRYKFAIQQLNKDAQLKLRRYRAALKDGSITREQYQRLVKQLKMEVQKQKSEYAQGARLAISKCYETLLEGIHKILTPEQWRKFLHCKKGS